MSRNRWRGTWLALALLGVTATPALAGEPAGERPLTADEIRASERKIAEAERNLAILDGTSPSGAQACPAPESSDPAPQACTPPQGFLSVEARDQAKNIYCGPAVGQVITNYVWAMGAGQNKFGQKRLAGWMATDVNGGTSAPYLATGLNKGTNGAPRKPAGWVWVVTNLQDRNGNGLTGDELHGYFRSNISVSRMPLAVPVKPHEPNAAFWLVSWPNPVASVGHWIAGYGWRGLYDGTDSARVWYTDSSRDEGGSTGKFNQPLRHIAILINNHTKRLVW